MDSKHEFEKEVYGIAEPPEGEDLSYTSFYTSLEDLEDSVTEVAVYKFVGVKKLIIPKKQKRRLK
jgi:hypothetical protein